MKRRKIWSIAASDCSAGAGSQADLRMAQALGCDCLTLVIALTAQSSQGVRAVELVGRNLLEHQWQSMKEDGWPDAIKIGWLPADTGLVDWLLERLAAFPGPVIWDPVLSASQGGLRMSPWPEALLRRLLQRVDVLTPNRAEGRILADLTGETSAADIAAALQQQGAGHILLTGGDSPLQGEAGAAGLVEDHFFSAPSRTLGQQELPGPNMLAAFRLQHRRLERRVHGTGCHLASALACGIAQGYTLYDAVIRAVVAARLSIRFASERANGYDNAWAMPVAAADAGDWPLVLPAAASALPAGSAFPQPQRALGLYGLVDNLEHLQTLLQLGVDTLQWRVKEPQVGFAQQTRQAIELCREAGVPLYINDDWRLAIELGAYGVHLGQEDLLTADLRALQDAGLHLGISTHSDWEIARARAIAPSYIAFGPVHPPLSKQLKYPPLGYDQLHGWCRLFGKEVALTCIGGITTGNIQQVRQCGMPSAAIVTDLRADDGLPQRHRQLRAVYG